MASHRAAKSGFAAEAQEKVNSKYDEGIAVQVLEWIKGRTQEDFSTDGSMDNFYEVLNDGYILAKLINSFGTEHIKAAKVKREKFPFKKMELVNLFTETAKGKFGLEDTYTFQTCSLTERTDLNAVLVCLESFGRKTGAPFAKKEATANVRNFTQEQLNESKKVVSLQMGTNKGASQAGMNFGKQRMIND